MEFKIQKLLEKNKEEIKDLTTLSLKAVVMTGRIRRAAVRSERDKVLGVAPVLVVP